MQKHRNTYIVTENWIKCDERKTRAGNVFFIGPRIYSYGSHFVMAERIHNAKGAVAYFVNSNTYSATTNAHQAVVRRALGGVTDPVFTFPFAKDWEVPDVTDKAVLRVIVNGMLTDAKNKLASAKRARTYKDMHLCDAAQRLREAARMSDFFKLGVRIPKQLMEAA